MSDENKQHQGEPVAWLVYRGAECLGVYRSNPAHWAHGYRLEPLYTHADPGEVERLRAQLAERDALLVKANYVVDHARTIDKQAFGRGTQNVDPGLFRGLGNLLAQYDEAISASAEPSAPALKKCSTLKDCNVRYSNSSHGYVDPNRVDQGGSPSTSAPVERDERAEFEACFDRTLKEQEAGLEHYQVSTMRFGKEVMWGGWKARAALERK